MRNAKEFFQYSNTKVLRIYCKIRSHMCDANSNQCQKVVKTATFKCEEGKKINHYFRCCWQPQGNFHFDLPFLEKSDEAQSD